MGVKILGVYASDRHDVGIDAHAVPHTYARATNNSRYVLATRNGANNRKAATGTVVVVVVVVVVVGGRGGHW